MEKKRIEGENLPKAKKITAAQREYTIDNETKPLKDWLEQYDLNMHTYAYRVKTGMIPEEALKMPLRNRRTRLPNSILRAV